MTKSSSKKKSDHPNLDFETLLNNQMLHYIGSVFVLAVGLLTLLALVGITGDWGQNWDLFLRRWFGWGRYVIAIVIVAIGVLWLYHHLDRPIKLRWRPVVGAEVAFFALLALTHTIGTVGRMPTPDADINLFAWDLMETGQAPSGGMFGWAVSILLMQVAPFVAIVVLFVLLVFGLGLALDVTWKDFKQMGETVVKVARQAATSREWVEALGAERPAAAERPASPKPARQRPAVQPKPKPAKAQQLPLGEARPLPPMPPKPAEALEKVTPRRKEPVPQPAALSRTGSLDEVSAEVRSRPRPTLPPLPRVYNLPDIELLNEPEGPVLSDEEIREKSRIIEETLAQFGLPVEVAEVRVGPTVTQFGVSPGFVQRGSDKQRHKVRVNQISALSDDLALALAAPRLRVEAPVPGRSIVGIEVPNSKVQLVGVREVMDSEVFRSIDSPLAFALGRDVAGEAVASDLARMPHLLISGTTGSGKSVCIKAIITSLIYRNTPADLRMVMIDPKMVELVRFNGLPHLYGQVEVDLDRLVNVLRWVALEMDDRYKLFAGSSARNLDDYNRMMKKEGQPIIPRIVVLVDELADLMMLAPDEVERTICRIAQMARATGIHLVMATQRPSVDVVTGLIKANFPARISFATVSQTDSRVILDMPGAETLMGDGDMLFLAADAGYPVRVQGSFVSEEELERVVDFWADQGGSIEEEAPWEDLIRDQEEREELIEEADDELLPDAIDLVHSTGSASTSLIQRRLHIGHPRAARLMRMMEEMGVVGPAQSGGRRRRVIGSDEEE